MVFKYDPCVLHKMVTVYVLKLNDDNVFYIGATERMWEDRITDLATGINVPKFVGKRKFKVEEVIQNVTSLEEMTTTLRYMKEYGIDNARGACFSNLILTQKQLNMIMNFMDILDCCEKYLTCS